MAVTMQDPSARLSGDVARSRRLRRIRAILRPIRAILRRIQAIRRPRRPERAIPEARMRNRELRRLAAMDRSLTAEAPRLASMFTMFGQLASGEPPGGAERLPAPARPEGLRGRPRRVNIAVLLALAVVAAVCFALSTQIHAAARTCSTTGVTGTTAIAVSPGAGPTLSCSAYATSK
jgi:hypothetical protein